MTWIFPRLGNENPPSDAHTDEFFGGDRKVRPDQFLRELLQNSLDAKDPERDDEPVFVNFTWGH